MCDNGGDMARLAASLLEDLADGYERAGRPTCPDPMCGICADDGADHADGCRFAAYLRLRPARRPARARRPSERRPRARRPSERRPRARGARFDAVGRGGWPSLVVELDDGRTVSAPLRWFPRLAHATRAELEEWSLIGRGGGIHWPLLDEDISVEGLLAGSKSGESRASVGRWLAARRADRRRGRAASSFKPLTPTLRRSLEFAVEDGLGERGMKAKAKLTPSGLPGRYQLHVLSKGFARLAEGECKDMIWGVVRRRWAHDDWIRLTLVSGRG